MSTPLCDDGRRVKRLVVCYEFNGAPHCSQKLFSCGLSVPQFGHGRWAGLVVNPAGFLTSTVWVGGGGVFFMPGATVSVGLILRRMKKRAAAAATTSVRV